MPYRKEKEVIQDFRKLMHWLRKNISYFDFKFVKIHGSNFVSGEPDVIGVWIRREISDCPAVVTPFAIEFKSPDAERSATARQNYSLGEWQRAGARAGVATTAEEAAKIAGIPKEWLAETEWTPTKPLRRREYERTRAKQYPDNF